MKRKNMISMVTSLALVGVVAVGGTLALLTSQTESLTNEFTVGDGYEDTDFFLREHDVDQVTTGTVEENNYGGYNQKTPPAWKTDSNGEYTGIEYKNIVANTTIDKDPQFGLAAGAPDSWIVAYLDLGENFDPMFDINAIDTNSVNGQWYRYEPEAGEKYVPVNTVNDVVSGKYYIFNTVISGEESTDPLFTQLKVVSVTDENGDVLETSDIVVKGVAVQASVGDKFEDARDAVMEAALSIHEFQ